MMIKVEAIVREEVFEDVKEALNAIDVMISPYTSDGMRLHRGDIKRECVVQK